MLLTHFKQVFFDPKLLQYWIARATQMSLLFMFGATLSGSGYNLQDTFFLWMVLYFVQGAVLGGTQIIPVAKQINVIRLLSALALTLALVILFWGFDAYLYLFVIALMQPAFREVIHETIIYIREKNDWALGIDVATAFMNEGGKAVGGLFIALIGFLSNVDNVALMSFVIFCIACCGFYFQSFYHPAQNDVEKEVIPIGSNAKIILLLSCIHNSLFFGAQFFLSLSILDSLRQSGLGQDALSILGGILSIVILSGLVINTIIQQRAGVDFNRVTQCNLLWKALASLTSVCFFILANFIIHSFGLIDSFTLALSTGVGVGLLQGLGTFFSLGFFQFIDVNYASYKAPERKQLRKRVMNFNMIFSNITPGLVLGGFSLLFLFSHSMSFNSIAVFSIIGAIEIVITICGYLLVQQFNHTSNAAIDVL